MIVIVDYGMGNLASIKNMVHHLGHESIISGDASVIDQADKLFLPGVGHFKNAITSIDELELRTVIDKKALEDKVPILGICLGMQLLTDYSEEGDVNGLGYIHAQTRKFSFENNELKVPHMGWDYVEWLKEDPLLEGMTDEDRFYFVHSYYVECDSEANSLGRTDYGMIFDSVIKNDNVIGTQFHPEKSHKFGMKLMRNFLENY